MVQEVQELQARFTILGEPKGKGRPRFNTRTGHAVTPKDTVNYETLVHMEYLAQCENKRFPDDAMLDMRILAYYSIPKSKSKKVKAQMVANEIRPTKKPDMDNVVKLSQIPLTRWRTRMTRRLLIANAGSSTQKNRGLK